MFYKHMYFSNIIFIIPRNEVRGVYLNHPVSLSVDARTHLGTVKHFLFARTLFSRKFARALGRENKVLANYL